MLKFVIEKTKGDDAQILYIAKDKEDALSKGEQIAATTPESEGIITLERRELTENGKPADGRTEIFEAWNVGMTLEDLKNNRTK